MFWFLPHARFAHPKIRVVAQFIFYGFCCCTEALDDVVGQCEVDGR